MEMEKDEYESEAADRILRINSGADGGGDIADACFCYAVHADRGGVAESVLRDADGRTEEHAAHGIAAAYAEIDRDEQRQIDEFCESAILVKEGLQDKRQKTDEGNGAAVVFVDFDIGFRSGAGAQHGVHINYACAEWMTPDCLQRRGSPRSGRVLRTSSASIPAE